MESKPHWSVPGDAMRAVPLREIRIKDALFSRYLSLVSDFVVPYQWNALNDRLENTEPSHCIANFRIAAGDQQGEFQGAVFQDTDLYKWLETVAFCIANGTGEQYAALADEAIDLIRRAQEKDGYINTYFTIKAPEKKWTNLVEGHELYSGGHLIEAAVAYYEATGKRPILDVACRFADLVASRFGAEEGKCHGYPGHQEIELALVKLYRATGETRYLELARYFIYARGQKPNYLLEEIKARKGDNLFPEFAEYDAAYAQSHLPVLEQTTAVGHAVRATYMYSAMADLALELGDEALAHACQTLYENIVHRRMYLTGGIGSSGKLERFTTDYDLPNDSAYCESCASIGLMMFGQRMARLTGEASYYDTVERALCNTVLAGMSIQGDRYFYVNPLEVWPDNCLPSTSMSHVKPVRQKWFVCACCPPNIARTLASLGQYIYAKAPGRLYVQQFISSSVTTDVDGRTVSLTMEADYMRSGTVKLHACGSATLAVRIPAYFRDAALTVNGAPASLTIERGYALIPVNGETEIELRGRVEAHFVAANRQVREDLGQVAMEKGPYVYCLEEQDNGDLLANIYVDPTQTLAEGAPLEGFPGALPTLELQGERLVETIEDPDALYGLPHFAKKAVALKAVPYAQWCNRTPGEMRVWLRAKL